MSQVVEKFKTLYASGNQIPEAELTQVYAEDIIFVDPIHRIEGRENLAAYLATMYANVYSCRFDYQDQMVQQQQACIRWNMFFRHRKLSGGREIEVRGITVVEFDELIVKHEDFFDVGSMLYENIPVLGSCVRYLKGRIS